MTAARPLLNAMAIAMVKNEADVIEAFARHTLHFVDLLVVIENRSTDGTREILQALRREGLRILLVDDPVVGYFQSEKVTHTYRKLAPVFQPDLVYLLDADEFLRAPDRGAMEAALSPLVPGSIGLLPWQTHVPPADLDPAAVRRDPLGVMTRRRRVEEPTYYKAVIRRHPDDDGRLVIDQGSHGVRRSDGQPVAAQPVQGVALAHLPVRSTEQLTAKVVVGWHACLARQRRSGTEGQAYQWQGLYARVVHGETLDGATLVDVALGYAQTPRAGRCAERDTVLDPVPAHHGPLTHLGLGRHAALAKVALSAEALVRGADVPPAPAASPALDLPPVADVVELLQLRRVATSVAGRRWLAALQSLGLGVTDAADGQADLLLVPDLALADSLSLARAFGKAPDVRVVLWPDRARRGDELQQELAAWSASGFVPDLLMTLGMRGLASYAALRHGALLLRPAVPGDAPKAAAIQTLLCHLAGAQKPWRDPQPQLIRHPLQALELAAA